MAKAVKRTVWIRARYNETLRNPFRPINILAMRTKVTYTIWIEVPKNYNKANYEQFAKAKTPDGYRFSRIEERADPPDRDEEDSR